MNVTDCKHPIANWHVLSTEMIPTERGGGLQAVPSVWCCMDCGFVMRRLEQCPKCTTLMTVSGYLDMYSTRFRCPADGQFYDRSALNPVAKSKPRNRFLAWLFPRKSRLVRADELSTGKVYHEGYPPIPYPLPPAQKAPAPPTKEGQQ